MRRFVILAILFAASSASAQGFRGGLSLGTGVGRDLFGAELEVGFDHWTALVGYGLGPLLSTHESIALGVRWSMQPDGSGFGVALQGMTTQDDNPSFDSESLTVIALTAHWRWKWRYFFIDVGIGPAITFDSYRFPKDDYGSQNNKLVRTTVFGFVGGFQGEGQYPSVGIPDVELGIGVPF